ncbi:chloramphenicol acetyltransferase [Pedobacter xixiisoli]|uniref:Chloramphenicol O-acetyltransferase type A n=1 Tax=Pedobacter xixiisoli TaxID=1476464 RepID=A0A285ZYG2_9SPHI|nr:chloramphenicol acetyltransferase [Pedobacter xixiisoli]SOD14685.1 chloramphenicol O-acetyltransferase type A [Pedobacter xixiisoli]
MKKINIDTWKRRDHFKLFSQFEEPFFGVVVNINCSKAYTNAKTASKSFFLHYLYRALKAANSIEEFRYRVLNGDVILHDQASVSTTINRPNGTFGFGYFDYHDDENIFIAGAQKATLEVQNTEGLTPSQPGASEIHFSAIPWVDFTSLSHARSFAFPDSAPKISFGKVTDKDGIKTMALSIHIHHGLADGYHVGQFVERFQKLMDEE